MLREGEIAPTWMAFSFHMHKKSSWCPVSGGVLSCLIHEDQAGSWMDVSECCTAAGFCLVSLGRLTASGDV